MTENLRQAKDTIKGVAGIYCVKYLATGTMYIGSSVDIASRIMDHLFYGSTNIYLHNAIIKYSLSAFSFILVEAYVWDPKLTLAENKANLLALEQSYLDWLFRLPAELRYNFLFSFPPGPCWWKTTRSWFFFRLYTFRGNSC